MTDNTKPEALRLADALAYCDASVASQAAAELRRQHAEIADLRAQLASIYAGGVSPLMGAAGDGWLQDGSLLYRLTDDRQPENRDEINVTMADGSRSLESRTRRASELLDRIRATPPSSAKGVAHG